MDNNYYWRYKIIEISNPNPPCTHNLWGCLLSPRVRLHQDQDTIGSQQVSGLLQKLGWVWDPAESVCSEDAANLTQGREVTGIPHHELNSAAVLVRGRDGKMEREEDEERNSKI